MTSPLCIALRYNDQFKEAQKQAQILLEQDEQKRRQQHEQLQRTLEIQLREAEAKLKY